MFTTSEFLTAETSEVESFKVVLDFLSSDESVDRTQIFDEYFRRHSYLDTEYKRFKLTQFGYFTQDDIVSLSLILKEKGMSTSHVSKPVILNLLIKKLEEKYLVTHEASLGLYEFRVQKNLYLPMKSLGAIDNILYGPLYVIDRYSSAIPKITRMEVEGDQRIGCATGFLIMKGDKYYVLTNKHVVDPQKYSIESIESHSIQYCQVSSIILPKASNLDLAAIPVTFEGETDYIHVSSDPNVLTPVIAVGYPEIVMSDDNLPFAHAGQVNGHVSDIFNQKLQIISCQISSGNSGGPLMDEFGLCVGLVTETKNGKDVIEKKIGYGAAMLPSTIKSFIDEEIV